MLKGEVEKLKGVGSKRTRGCGTGVRIEWEKRETVQEVHSKGRG